MLHCLPGTLPHKALPVRYATVQARTIDQIKLIMREWPWLEKVDGLQVAQIREGLRRGIFLIDAEVNSSHAHVRIVHSHVAGPNTCAASDIKDP